MGRQSLILFAMKVLAIISVPTRILAITTTPMDPKLGYRKAAAWNLGAFGDFSIKLWGNPANTFDPKTEKLWGESETLSQSLLGFSWNPAPEKNNCGKNTHSSTELGLPSSQIGEYIPTFRILGVASSLPPSHLWLPSRRVPRSRGLVVEPFEPRIDIPGY